MSDSIGCHLTLCGVRKNILPDAASIGRDGSLVPNRRLSGSTPSGPSALRCSASFKPNDETLEVDSNGYESASNDAPPAGQTGVSYQPNLRIEHCHETVGEVVATGERHVLHECVVKSSERVDREVAYQNGPATDWSKRQHSNRQQLASTILQRISKRIPGRVRLLSVHVGNDAIVLFGQCSTYYSKQMAQHVAMGVLDYQKLVNNIRVQPEG
jgi:hypothetical protein